MYDPQTKIWEAGTKRCVCMAYAFPKSDTVSMHLAGIRPSRTDYDEKYFKHTYTRDALFRLPKSFGEHAILCSPNEDFGTRNI